MPRRDRRLAVLASCRGALAALVSCGSMFGCSADTPLNPSFPLTLRDTRSDLRRVEADRKPLDRPLVLVAGHADPGIVPWGLGMTLTRLVLAPPAEDPNDRMVFVGVSFPMTDAFDACRRRLINAVDKAFPTDDPAATREVDVIAMSMGGLVARWAAADAGDGSRRLRIRRLFTIATPHRGADLAAMPTWDARVIAMRANSEFLGALDQELAQADYEIIPYVRLGDTIVGAANAAPPGWPAAWWVANRPFEAAHFDAAGDPRILADIYRHLRGETPYTTWPPAPLPSTDWDSTTSLADSMTPDDAS